MKKSLLFALIVVGLTACGGSGGNGDAASQEPEPINRFDTETYAFTYRGTGSLPGDSWRIGVESGVVVSVQHLGEDEPSQEMTVGTAPTISDLTTRIQNCADSADCEISELDYDDSHHYPTVYYASQGEEGSGFIISDFQSGQQVSSATNWGSYIFHYEEHGNHTRPGKWEIQVEGGEVIHAGYLGDDAPEDRLRTDEAPTIEELMGDVESCSESSQCVVRKLEYNEKTSQPESFSASKGQKKTGFTIYEYRPL